MRRPLVLLVTCAALTACGGGGSSTLSASDLADRQTEVDTAARRIVSALVTGLDAEPPSPTTLGRGLYAGCDNGDPDEASYFVDTFVTYDVRPPAQADDEVGEALNGLAEGSIEMTGSRMLNLDGVTANVSSQEKGGGSAGQNIFVRTECLKIGEEAIADFNAGNGRDVPITP